MIAHLPLAASSRAIPARPVPSTNWTAAVIGAASGFAGTALALARWWPGSGETLRRERWRHRIVSLVLPIVLISAFAWATGEVAAGTAKALAQGLSAFLVGAVAAFLFVRPRRGSRGPARTVPSKPITVDRTRDGDYLGPGPASLRTVASVWGRLFPVALLALLSSSIDNGLYSTPVRALLIVATAWFALDRLRLRVIADRSQLRVRRAFTERQIDLASGIDVRIRALAPALRITDETGGSVSIPSSGWRRRDDALLRARIA
jgi:hypothetical protein